MTKPLLFASLLLFTGCVDDAADDPIDESFIGDGKADAFGIADGSPEAMGVLQLVNTADGTKLRNDVHLSQKAYEAILAYRKREGIDTWFNPFDNLAELDAVPYVGAGTFGKLLDYAKDNGYVSPDPFVTPCEGPTIGLARLQALTSNGTKQLPSGATWVRTRSCNGPLGCGAWSAPRKLGAPRDSTIGYQVIGDQIRFQPQYRRVVSTLLPQGYLDNITTYQWTMTVHPAEPSTITDTSGFSSYWFGSNVSGMTSFSSLSVAFTDHCFRSFGQLTPTNGTAPTTEVVHLATF